MFSFWVQVKPEIIIYPSSAEKVSKFTHIIVWLWGILPVIQSKGIQQINTVYKQEITQYKWIQCTLDIFVCVFLNE